MRKIQLREKIFGDSSMNKVFYVNTLFNTETNKQKLSTIKYKSQHTKKFIGGCVTILKREEIESLKLISVEILKLVSSNKSKFNDIIVSNDPARKKYILIVGNIICSVTFIAQLMNKIEFKFTEELSYDKKMSINSNARKTVKYMLSAFNYACDFEMFES